eukprot:368654-Pyramimonas_sp.AAC.1
MHRGCARECRSLVKGFVSRGWPRRVGDAFRGHLRPRTVSHRACQKRCQETSARAPPTRAIARSAAYMHVLSLVG